MTRNQYKCIYMSSYDRGLEHLLNMWGDIKGQVPDAELHIYYGWNLFDAVYGSRGSQPNPERQAWKDKMNRKMKQDGITHHGRVGQKDLFEFIKTCGLWLYPTDFYEINCISAMQAQAFGAIPVVTNYAALKETVQWGVKVDGDIYDPQVRKEFVKQTVKLLKDKKEQERIRQEMMPWAKKKFRWSTVAKQWDNIFKGQEFERAKELLLEHDKSLKEFMPI